MMGGSHSGHSPPPYHSICLRGSLGGNAGGDLCWWSRSHSPQDAAGALPRACLALHLLGRCLSDEGSQNNECHTCGGRVRSQPSFPCRGLVEQSPVLEDARIILCPPGPPAGTQLASSFPLGGLVGWLAQCHMTSSGADIIHISETLLKCMCDMAWLLSREQNL